MELNLNYENNNDNHNNNKIKIYNNNNVLHTSNLIKSIEKEFYINRNFDYCLKEINLEFDKLRSKDSNNRHKCLRNSLCNCIYYGKFLIEIFNSNKEEFAKQFDNYYYCCPIYLPYELFTAIIKHMLSFMEFSTARVWIEAYLTYTVRDDNNKNITKGFTKNSNKLTLTNREVLYIYIS